MGLSFGLVWWERSRYSSADGLQELSSFSLFLLHTDPSPPGSLPMNPRFGAWCRPLSQFHCWVVVGCALMRSDTWADELACVANSDVLIVAFGHGMTCVWFGAPQTRGLTDSRECFEWREL